MENYIVSARKYRPSTFRNVVGQQALTHTLKSAIDNSRLAHAYLFCGPRGVGKTSCARIFAKTINCLNPTPDHEACNECESCRAFNEQHSYNIVELDAASNNSVDDMRNLIDQVRIPPPIGKYRVYIIDEVHMLSAAAFNAFLKTLEEPPAHAIFILATTEKHKIIPTILSRCQIYDFARITTQDIVSQLQYIAEQEGIKTENAALNVIAQKADGAMRDALSIFDQVAASSEGNITYQNTIANLNVLDHDYYFRLVEAFKKSDVPEALLIYKDVRDHGFDSKFFINGLAQHLRDLMVAYDPRTRCLLEMSDELADEFAKQAVSLNPRWYYAAMDICNTCDLNYPTASNKQFAVELALIKICQLLAPAPAPTPGGGGGAPLRSIAQPAAPQPAAPQQQAAPQSAAPHASAQGQAAAVNQPKSQAQQPETARYESLDGGGVHRFNAKKTLRFESTENQTAVVDAPVQNRNAVFNQAMLTAAWNNFIRNHPHRRMLISAMGMVQPTLVSANAFEICVSEVQKSIFDQDTTEILTALRNELQNDYVGMNIRIVQTAPRPKYKTPREIIEDIRTAYPAIESLINDFKLSMK